jgi:superfamily I DNA and RNA helicase
MTDITKELNPEDISIVCMDNRNAKTYFDKLSVLFEKKNIKTFNLLNVPANNTLFKVKNHVTLSTIYNAKGNEAGSIYIIGIDSVFSEKNDITERNKIFTAMTRSLAWVTLTGVGESIDYCINELKELSDNNYELRFNQPSEKEVKTIRQGIDKKQKLLNKIERLAEDLAKESDLTKDEIVEQLKKKIAKK